MSETETTNVEAAAEQPPAKKSKLKLIIIALVVILGIGGAGGYFFFMRAPADGTEEAEAGNEELAKEEKKAKKKESKKEPEEEEEEEPSSKKKKNPLTSSLPDDEDVKAVVELQPFIVNLADEGEARYLRMSVSVGIGGEEGAHAKPDPIFVTRVRNAMLAVLSTKKSEEVLSNEGKAKLRKELLKAAQAASEEPEVAAIYITDFIVQL